MPRDESQQPSSERPAPARPPLAKDDPHLAPESGDKPDAATPGEDDLSERGTPT